MKNSNERQIVVQILWFSKIIFLACVIICAGWCRFLVILTYSKLYSTFPDSKFVKLTVSLSTPRCEFLYCTLWRVDFIKCNAE